MIDALTRYRLSTIWLIACTWTAYYLELTQGRFHR